MAAIHRSLEQVVSIRRNAEESLRELYTAAGIVVPGDSLNLVEEERLDQLIASPGTDADAVDYFANIIIKCTELVRLLVRLQYRLEPPTTLADHVARGVVIEAELDALGV